MVLFRSRTSAQLVGFEPGPRDFAQAGYSPWLGLTLIVPLVNLIVFIWFAFSKWPVRAELDRLRLNSPTRT